MIDEKTALLYAQMPEYKFLVNKTVAFIRWALAKVKNPYLACSFGKDSSVMLHLVFNQYPNIPVYWITFPETRLLDNYEEITNEWIKKSNIDLKEVFVNVDADEDYADKKAFPLNYDSYFVGITKEESFGRRVSLSKGKFLKKINGQIRISPLSEWKIMDIAAYTISNKLPILSHYKANGFNERTVTSFTEDIYGFRQNQLNDLKRRNMSSYNQLLKQFPKLSLYS